MAAMAVGSDVREQWIEQARLDERIARVEAPLLAWLPVQFRRNTQAAPSRKLPRRERNARRAFATGLVRRSNSQLRTAQTLNNKSTADFRWKAATSSVNFARMIERPVDMSPKSSSLTNAREDEFCCSSAIVSCGITRIY